MTGAAGESSVCELERAVGPEVPLCQDCGACCFAEGEQYVFLWGSDHARLRKDEQRALTRFEGTHCYMEMGADGCCAALKVEQGRFTCSVYERRPALCHELERGGEACDAARELFGAKALAALRRRSAT